MGTYDYNYSPVYWYATSSTSTASWGIDTSTTNQWFAFSSDTDKKCEERKTQKDITQEEFDDIF